MKFSSHQIAVLVATLCVSALSAVHAFHLQAPGLSATTRNHHNAFTTSLSAFATDGSEYSSKDSDYDDEDNQSFGGFNNMDLDDEEDAPVQELQPVPMSKNSGNRFVALLWDHELDTKGRDSMDLHIDRNELVEDHVMFCRKRNLYNETFNSDSMVDILRSLPM